MAAPPTDSSAPAAVPEDVSKSAAGRGDVAGTVVDSSNGQALGAAEVALLQNGKFVSGTYTDAFGRFRIHNLDPGTYQVRARVLGFASQVLTVVLTPGAEAAEASFQLAPAPVELPKVEVSAAAPAAVDIRSGDQSFQKNDYRGSPVTTTSQILQQSMSGAARAPTGEVHIRGQHAEYTYYVDGVPVTSGVSGSLNELFDPSIINRIDFKTGSWDAEFGNKNAAIVDVVTRIPNGKIHADVSGYAGSFNSNGQTVTASTSGKRWGGFISGARQAADMRTEPVMGDPSTNAPINFHNHGEDLSGFGKLTYTMSSTDLANLDVNWSRTKFQVPYDSTGGVMLDDHQQDINSFAHATWRHVFGDAGDETRRELFAALLYRHGSLAYAPGPNDLPSFVFYPDTVPYNLTEDRSFDVGGVKLDYDHHVSHALELKTGTLASITRGHEKFTTTNAAGAPGPVSDSDLNGSDFGIYAQAAITPSDRWEFRPGLRYDAHTAPFAGTQSQVSPRIRVSMFPDAGNSFWVYYGRLFIPTNIEDLRAVTSVADSGVVTSPTLPEKDDFYEAGYVHRFPAGVVAKLSGYHKDSKPGIDDNTVPGSSIVTSVNINRVWVTGIEATLDVKPPGRLAGFLNAALCHAYGEGPVTGGFFPAATPQGKFDLDHDQRVSIVAGMTYAPRAWFLSATGIYGTGLTNGQDPDASYGTGLLDFNTSIKVPASFILNASAGYAFTAGGVLIRPEIYVDNAFDNQYLLKGAFFSGASVGRPRSVQGKVTFSL